jgi:pyridinium-3,5-bisthiocarboxylic acid mononucleotide nickel chelatase
MKIAYFDCPSGAAGDMILGALVDAGLAFETLRDELLRLPLAGYSLERREVMKGGFRATKIDVHIHGEVGHEEAGGPKATGSGPAAGPGGHEAPAGRGHSHRTLPAILDVLHGSRLPMPVLEAATRVFRRLAEAEGRVHGVSPEEVRFHEVGAVDAIVDITGACIGMHLLGVQAVHCSALPVGGGFVMGAHGKMPVPAPGTAELLRGMPVVDTGVRRELVTPTGAAILSTLAASAGSMPPMTLAAVGYGAGTMELPTPNVVRLFLGEAAGAPPTARTEEVETILQVETTVDDMSPQLWEPLVDSLFEAGALDVYLTPVLMKRSRPGVVLTALCPPATRADVARILFRESTTIGVRWTVYERERLGRETVTLATAYGSVDFKVSRLDGRAVTATPEFEQVRRIARDKGLAVREVLDEARAAGRRLLG